MGGFFLYFTSSPQGGATVLKKKSRQSLPCPSQPSSCSSQEESSEIEYDTFLLLLVSSKPENVAERRAARETWMSKATADRKRMTFKFVIGVKEWSTGSEEKLRYEAELHGDIAFVAGIHREYKGYSLKMILKWARGNYKFKYFMKIEDSTYIMTEKVLTSLENVDDQMALPLVWGSILFNSDSYIMKNSHYWGWPFQRFSIPIPSSSGYVLSASIVNAVLGDDNLAPVRTFPDEGVTLGLWLSTLDVEYRTFQTYKHIEGLPTCPKDKRNMILFEYEDIDKGFRDLHFCFYLEESWFRQDHVQPVKLMRKTGRNA
jgi:beta-1,3-galactosyltransferase 1